MRDRISRYARVGSKVLIFAAPLLLAASVAFPAALDRLSAEFQSPGEISTITTPAGGGVVVYDKTLNIPPGVAYITFSAQGDTHQQLDPITGADVPGTGAALLMSASITDAAGNVTICQPMATAGGAALFGAPWMTLVKLPDGEAPNNCNDGAGGPADCHDNAFSFSCCALLAGGRGGISRDVKISMASSNGGRVFYEDSTIYIDRGPNPDGGFCQAVGTGPH
jgi:hypothetical protein